MTQQSMTQHVLIHPLNPLRVETQDPYPLDHIFNYDVLKQSEACS